MKLFISPVDWSFPGPGQRARHVGEGSYQVARAEC